VIVFHLTANAAGVTVGDVAISAAYPVGEYTIATFAYGADH